jgi:hypothetical protein
MKFGFAKTEENTLSMRRRFVTAGKTASIMRSGGGYCVTATVCLSLKEFFLVVLLMSFAGLTEWIFVSLMSKLKDENKNCTPFGHYYK